MEYLVALADEQQFTRAAAVCRVSQSGLSAAIRSLEDELGTTLFTRTTRRVEPTEAGLALLPYARTMLASATAARDAVVQRYARAVGHAARRRRAVPRRSSTSRPLLERFRRRYPLVDIHFTQAGSHDLVGRVRDGDLDVAFVATTDHLDRHAAHGARVGGRSCCCARRSIRSPASGRGLGRPPRPGLHRLPASPGRSAPLNDDACAARGVHPPGALHRQRRAHAARPRPPRPRRRARAPARRGQAAGGRTRAGAVGAERDAAVGGIGRHRQSRRGIRPCCSRSSIPNCGAPSRCTTTRWSRRTCGTPSRLHPDRERSGVAGGDRPRHASRSGGCRRRRRTRCRWRGSPATVPHALLVAGGGVDERVGLLGQRDLRGLHDGARRDRVRDVRVHLEVDVRPATRVARRDRST